MSIEQELMKQQSLQSANDTFENGEIIESIILECTYVNESDVEYNGDIYEIPNSKDKLNKKQKNDIIKLIAGQRYISSYKKRNYVGKKCICL